MNNLSAAITNVLMRINAEGAFINAQLSLTDEQNLKNEYKEINKINERITTQKIVLLMSFLIPIFIGFCTDLTLLFFASCSLPCFSSITCIPYIVELKKETDKNYDNYCFEKFLQIDISQSFLDENKSELLYLPKISELKDKKYGTLKEYLESLQSSIV